jgi:hypothetical protein
MPLRMTLRQLESLRDRLARARASRADPWQLTELQAAHDRLAERAMAEQDDPNDTSLAEEDMPPRMLVPAPPVPVRNPRGAR